MVLLNICANSVLLKIFKLQPEMNVRIFIVEIKNKRTIYVVEFCKQWPDAIEIVDYNTGFAQK
jgi:hypothetical protein